MAENYKLRCGIVGHENDVRAITNTIIPEGGILSGSRDVTARIWVPIEMDTGFREGMLMRGHSNFIASVCFMPPDQTYENGLILTGSNDSTILAYTPDSPNAVFKMEGHEGTVCCLTAGKFGTLLSGSWDKTARVWLNQKCVMNLKGHEAAVWAVGIMPEQGFMLTGSADKTIKLWKAGKCEKTFRGHEDCVRGLAVMNSSEFLSCSNDSTVRRWSVSGDCLQIHYGHENFVYSIAVLPNGQDFISSGEDRTLRVWKGGNCVQTIAHPTQSVWTVCVLPNGDLVSGASDGVIRVFTNVPERMASLEDQKAFEDEVSAAEVPTQLGDIKHEDIPGPEVLMNPGTKNGQQKMVRQGKEVELYQWDSGQREWKKIGNVVGAKGGSDSSTGKTTYMGQEYDYVFSVDIEEGKPPLKLPFNKTEDPWFAAQRFLDKHSLSQSFLDQVANFIIEQTKGVTLGQETSGYVDPFTGGNRHVPGSQSASGVPQVGNSDPFTGEGRYVPGSGSGWSQGNVNPSAQSFGADPFTGSGSYKPGSNISQNTFFPQTTYLSFDNVNVSQIIGKLKEFNSNVESSLQVEENQLNSLESLMNGTSEEPLAILEMLLRWPIEYVFPVLDVLRVSIKHRPVCQKMCLRKEFIENLCAFLSSSSTMPAQMLTLRVLCNIFNQPEGEKLMTESREDLITTALNCRLTPNKNVQIALATLLLNYSVYFRDKLINEEAKSQCLLAVASVMENPMDPEAEFRLLVCLGTLLSGNVSSQELAKSIEIINLIIPLQSKVEPRKVGECASFVAKLLQR